MFVTRSLAFALVLFLPLAPPVPPAQQVPHAEQASAARAQIAKLVDSGQTVELDVQETKLWDFLEAAQPLLAVPVNYEPGEVANVRITQAGLMRVPLASFRDAFDAVLRRYDFITWDDISGGTTVIMVSKVTAGGGRPKLAFTPRLVTMQELEAGPSPRLALYTASIPLQHIDARDTLNVLMPVLDTSLESARPVDGANALLITATREHLLAARDMLAAVDLPGPEGGPRSGRLDKLEQQVSDLAARLAKLEAAGG